MRGGSTDSDNAYSLGWAEMKMILAKMIWSFDIELSESQKKDWSDQKIWVLHEKGPLFVKLGSTREAKQG